MPRKWTRRECFKHFGASCQKSSVELVGQSANSRVVVMCMWQDEIKREGDRMVYQSLTPRTQKRRNRPGAKERLGTNGQSIREHCDGN